MTPEDAFAERLRGGEPLSRYEALVDYLSLRERGEVLPSVRGFMRRWRWSSIRKAHGFLKEAEGTEVGTPKPAQIKKKRPLLGTPVGTPEVPPYPDAFEEFWKAFPKKNRTRKYASFQEWWKITSNGTTEDQVMSGLKAWSRTKLVKDGYPFAPVKFLKERIFAEQDTTTSQPIVTDEFGAYRVD